MACEVGFDCGGHEVAERLFVGGYIFRKEGGPVVDAVVLCAPDHQPIERDLPGLVRLPCLFYDWRTALADDTWATIEATVAEVVRRHRAGERVAVTCGSGYNRSALVAGRALRILFGWTPDAIVERIRALRGHHAFSNHFFVEALARPLPG